MCRAKSLAISQMVSACSTVSPDHVGSEHVRDSWILATRPLYKPLVNLFLGRCEGPLCAGILTFLMD